MQKIDRRQVLKAAAVATAGVAASVTGVESAFAASSPAVAAMSADGTAPASGPRVYTAPALGTTYSLYAGWDFRPRDGGTTYAVGGNGSTYLTAGSILNRRLEIANRSVITEIQWAFVKNDANDMTFFFTGFDAQGSNAGGLNKSLTVSGAANPAIQTASMAGPPITVDSSQFEWQMQWFPGSQAFSQLLYGVRVGYLNGEPGLTIFPNPRRIYGIGTVLAPGQSVTGIDATKQLDGVTPSGVPAGAKAAFCAVSSYGTGVISLYPDGTPDNGIGAWASQGTAGNGVNQGYNLVPLSTAGKFSFTNYFTSKAMYFDVWGFLA